MKNNFKIETIVKVYTHTIFIIWLEWKTKSDEMY